MTEGDLSDTDEPVESITPEELKERIDGNVLFIGDGLFTESVARPDLEDPEAAKNAARTLYESLIKWILTQPDDTIIATNLGQETPDDADAFELELGPNNCAASEEVLTN